MRVQEVWKGYKRCLLPPHTSPLVSCCGLLGRSDRDSVGSSNGICSSGPTGARLQGRKYFLYAMDHRDRVDGPGWKWWFATTWAFYILLGAAWYGPLVDRVLSMLTSPLPSLRLWQVGLQFLLNPLSTFRLTLWFLSIIVHGLLLSRHFTWSNRFLYAFVPALFPLVIPLVLPWMIIWAKLDRSHDAYEYTLDPTYEQEEEDEELKED